ncbi:hypothetical protein BAJUN_01660 [Bajunvirus bajun]|uniref:Uncharacterized protein n=1 Tax=Brevundimonas phage vB_BgoS-Bajun TaxID=2948594 RepID=A0A9E7STB3_9CAUD|nr:hypothetical protein BAJUN_01660 [Brevundimonas phage vB_BgoS-Bajun]
MTRLAIAVGLIAATAAPAHAVAVQARALQNVPVERLLEVRADLAKRPVLTGAQATTLGALDRLLTGRGWVLPVPAIRAPLRPAVAALADKVAALGQGVALAA